MTGDSGDQGVHRLEAPCCELGEGPAYESVTDTAWWFDIVGCTLYEHRLAEHRTYAHTLPRMASVVAAVDSGRQLLAMEDGLYLRERHSGELQLLQALEADNPLTRSNDGRVHPSGALWIGTMGKHAEKGAGSIYWYDGRELRCLFPGITIPNSIAFSPDGRTGYFADTALNQVWRVPLDASSGLPCGDAALFLEAGDLPQAGHFDGSVVDADGVLWNAAWGGGSVTGYRADGSLLRTLNVPARQSSCPCFVGDRLDRLLVTTAWQGYGEAERAGDPGAGFTYVLDAGMRGVADPAFRLN